MSTGGGKDEKGSFNIVDTRFYNDHQTIIYNHVYPLLDGMGILCRLCKAQRKHLQLLLVFDGRTMEEGAWHSRFSLKHVGTA